MSRPRARPTLAPTKSRRTDTLDDRNSAQVSSSPDSTSNHSKKTKGGLLSANSDYQTHHPDTYFLRSEEHIVPMQTTNWKKTPSPVSYFLIGIKLLPKNKTATATPIYPRTELFIIKNGDLKSRCDTIRGSPVIIPIIKSNYRNHSLPNRFVHVANDFRINGMD